MDNEVTKADLQINLIEAYQQLWHYWKQSGSCPCGARRESPNSHPHVTGCPTGAAIDFMADPAMKE